MPTATPGRLHPAHSRARQALVAGVALVAFVVMGASAPAAAADKPGLFSFNFGKSADEQRAAEGSAQLKELDQRLYAFADRYTTLIVSAADDMVQGNPNNVGAGRDQPARLARGHDVAGDDVQPRVRALDVRQHLQLEGGVTLRGVEDDGVHLAGFWFCFQGF